MKDLKLGTVKIDITPRHRLPLAGFAHRQGSFKKIVCPLHARILLFEQTEVNGTK